MARPQGADGEDSFLMWGDNCDVLNKQSRTRGGPVAGGRGLGMVLSTRYKTILLRDILGLGLKMKLYTGEFQLSGHDKGV
jgi:hypothetical protein